RHDVVDRPEAHHDEDAPEEGEVDDGAPAHGRPASASRPAQYTAALSMTTPVDRTRRTSRRPAPRPTGHPSAPGTRTRVASRPARPPRRGPARARRGSRRAP